MKSRSLLILLITIMLQGCVGGMVLHQNNRTFNGVGVVNADMPPTTSKCKNASTNENTKTIQSRYGLPTSIETNGDAETWRYKGSLGWSGIVPILVIPIPLIVPTGHRDTVLNFSNGKLVSVTNEGTSGPAAVCGLLMLHNIEFGCLVN